MRLWTYERPFQYRGVDYKVKFSFTFTVCVSQVYCGDKLLDETSQAFSAGLDVIEHRLQVDSHSPELSVSVGYYSWWNVGIEVRESDTLIYASHPGKDIHFGEKKVESLDAISNTKESESEKKERSQKWQRNKYSIFADIGLGAVFFIVAKYTGDLTTAALVGVTLGLALVVIQRFVKIDLLGGFAVFGTVMLLISAVFSLVFQSEQLVQLKGTFMGLLGASVFLLDGILKKGHYFGSRFDRYLSSPVEHQTFVIGLAIISACMAGLNYGATVYLSESAWLNYTTFFDMPIYLILFISLTVIAKKKPPTGE